MGESQGDTPTWTLHKIKLTTKSESGEITPQNCLTTFQLANLDNELFKFNTQDM